MFAAAAAAAAARRTRTRVADGGRGSCCGTAAEIVVAPLPQRTPRPTVGGDTFPRKKMVEGRDAPRVIGIRVRVRVIDDWQHRRRRVFRGRVRAVKWPSARRGRRTRVLIRNTRAPYGSWRPACTERCDAHLPRRVSSGPSYAMPICTHRPKTAVDLCANAVDFLSVNLIHNVYVSIYAEITITYLYFTNNYT